MSSESPSSAFESAHSQLQTPTDQMDGATDSQGKDLQYRTVLPLPAELRDSCFIYVEEGLFVDALTLLRRLIESGSSTLEDEKPQPVYLPPRNIIRLAMTLLVHPAHSSRVISDEGPVIPSLSMQLFRDILYSIGPINAQLNTAFSFSSRRSKGRRGLDGNDEEKESDIEADGHLNSSFAHKESLWNQADDFWHIVGWSFNCSIQMPHRWAYWSIFLDLMLKVLEADFDERLDEDAAKEGFSVDESDLLDKGYTVSSLQKSLLCKYLTPNGRSLDIKRVVKAIFADGSHEAMRAYPEVFRNEKFVPSKQSLKRKRDTKVNIDADEFGDYDEEDPLEPEPSSSISADEQAKSEPSLGGVAVNRLRLKLLEMLLVAGEKNLLGPQSSQYEVYHACFDSLRHLPIGDFLGFFSPVCSKGIDNSVWLMLLQFTLRRMIDTASPAVRKHDYGLTQEVLETQYLPFAANTSSAADNAKVSILIEMLFRTYSRIVKSKNTSRLQAAVTEGISKREAKVEGRRRGRRTTAADDENRAALKASSQRLRVLLSFL